MNEDDSSVIIKEELAGEDVLSEDEQMELTTDDLDVSKNEPVKRTIVISASDFPSEIMNAFNEYINLSDHIKTTGQELKVLKSRVKELEEIITDFMEETNNTEIVLEKGRFSLSQKEKKQTVNKEYVSTKLSEKYGHSDDVSEFVDTMFDSRPVLEIKNSLRLNTNGNKRAKKTG